MRKSWFASLALGLGLAMLGGCGSGTMNTPPTAQSAQVSLSMTDAPPAGVTVISFEVSLTGATLNPGGVDLLAGRGPIRIEVEKLETETAFLSTAKVAAGSFTSLNLTFANPELTFLNNTGSTLAGCANGSVCEIKPTGTLTATISGMFDVMAGAQTGLLVDVHLDSLISSTLGLDFSASGAVTVQQQTKREDDDDHELEDLDEIHGIVKSPANNQFTLQTTLLGDITVAVDNNTRFQDFENCAAANFSCLKDGQSVEVGLALMGAGTFLAKKVELQDDVAEAEEDELDGVVFKVDSPTQFEVVVIEELRNIANLEIGNPVTITLQAAATFHVDANGLVVPPSLLGAFECATDTSQLLPGQTVQISKVSMSGGPAPAPITITTDRVRLRRTRFTATVSGAPTGANFNVGNLPGLFTSNGVSTIQVQTSPQTNFVNVSGVSGLADGNLVRQIVSEILSS